MEHQEILTILIIILSLILFIRGKAPIEWVAIGAMVALVLFGVISPEQGLMGFSNPATITVLFMFILSSALLKTGALQFLTSRLSTIFLKSKTKGILILVVVVALLSAIVNNTPIVAMFIPVILQLSKKIGVSSTKLLIPLSFASIMGGMLTLFGTSTNLIVSGIAHDLAGLEIGVFALTPIAIILLLLGAIYLATVGFHILPDRESEPIEQQDNKSQYVADIKVRPRSTLRDKRIMDVELIRELQLDVVSVMRNGSEFVLPSGDFQILEGDVVKVRCSADAVSSLRDEIDLHDEPDDHQAELSSNDTSVVEIVVTAGSNMVGNNLKDLDFRRRFRASPLAIRHREDVVSTNLYHTDLRSGDIILSEVKTHYVERLKEESLKQNADFALISESIYSGFDKKRFGIVIGVIIAMIASTALRLIPIEFAVISAVVLLIVSNCISPKDAYNGVNWKIVFLMGAVFSFGQAFIESGLNERVSDALIGTTFHSHPILVLSMFYLAVSLLTEVLSNVATAAIMTPVGVAIALGIGVDPMPFLIASMIASSASFLTPVGYQTNTMVFVAGPYRFGDFWKVGIGLNLVFWIISSLLVPIFFPF